MNYSMLLRCLGYAEALFCILRGIVYAQLSVKTPYLRMKVTVSVPSSVYKPLLRTGDVNLPAFSVWISDVYMLSVV